MMCLPQVYHRSFAQTMVLLAMGQELLPPASVRSWAMWSDPPRFQLHLTHVLLTPGSATLVSESPFITPPPSPFHLDDASFPSGISKRTLSLTF